MFFWDVEFIIGDNSTNRRKHTLISNPISAIALQEGISGETIKVVEFIEGGL